MFRCKLSFDKTQYLTKFQEGVFFFFVFIHIFLLQVLPYRLQQELAPLHKTASLELSLEVDVDDALFDSVVKEVDFKKPALLPINSILLNLYAPEMLSAVDYCMETVKIISFAISIFSRIKLITTEFSFL